MINLSRVVRWMSSPPSSIHNNLIRASSSLVLAAWTISAFDSNRFIKSCSFLHPLFAICQSSSDCNTSHYCLNHPVCESRISGTSIRRSTSILAMSSKGQSSATSDTMNLEGSTGYLNAKDAYALDQELMSTPGFSLEQLMELAGLSVAEAVYDIASEKKHTESNQKKKKILVVCGPGNNGGDGLVAARHLVLFGYDCTVVYPKRPKNNVHFENLVRQCEDVGIPVLDSMPDDSSINNDNEYSIIIDAIFGFSFKGSPRDPFASILQDIMKLQKQQKTGLVVVSVDVPSGWNVDDGDVANMGFMPDVLISLTAPKHSSKNFQGRHFVGGRFLPPKLAKKYNIQMPPYPGVSQVMEITTSAIDVTNNESSDVSNDATDTIELSSMKVSGNSDKQQSSTVEEDWETQYAEYLAEKMAKEEEENKIQDEKTSNSKKEDNNENEDDDDWALQYYKYLAEKEASEQKTASLQNKENDTNNINDSAVSDEKNDNDEDWAQEYAKHQSEKEMDDQQ